MEQRVETLAGEDAVHVEKQRTWVRDHYDAVSQAKYDTIDGKQRLLKIILEEKWVTPDETWKLQSLGITFGDILHQKLDLIWVAVEDEYGRCPALLVPGTDILVFPLTAISKRVEKGEDVDIGELVDGFCELVQHRISVERPPQ